MKGRELEMAVTENSNEVGTTVAMYEEMREALVKTLDAIKSLSRTHSDDLPEDVRAILGRMAFEANAALQPAARNCDVGSTTMREACQKTLDLLMLHGDGKCRCVLTWDEFNDTQKMLRAVLAMPARNCDVGAVEEQMKRFEAYCNAHEPCESCPLDRPRVTPSCGVHWAQMPYEGKGESNE